MANSYTFYAFEITNLTVQECNWISKYKDETYFQLDTNPLSVIFYSDDNEDLEILANIIQEFIRTFRPDEIIGWEYACTCSKPRLGEFGGGCVVVSKDRIRWTNTADILQEMTDDMKKNPN